MRIPAITRALLLAVAFVLPPEATRAQVPLVGATLRDCGTFAHPEPLVTRPMLVGFHWIGPGRPAHAPDVLFSEAWWPPHAGQGPDTGGTEVGPLGMWNVDDNWRQPQVRGQSRHDVLVFDADEIWMDSLVDINRFDMLYVTPQSVGAMAGNAPQVTTLPTRHAIRWRPLVESQPDELAECTVAGWAPRGLISAYVVWSLPVAGHPAPTRADFLQDGAPHVADMSALDFHVADPDGLGGSDVEASDGLVLVNPDGVPDTGDEILELQVCPAAGLAQWYTVQPVVRGRFDYFDGGLTTVSGLPSALVDVTGDGVPDVADILVDGMHEFSGGCGLGLGLLWEGRILTSASPAQGGDLSSPEFCGVPPPLECDRGLRVGSLPQGQVYEPSALDRRNVDPLRTQRGTNTSLVVGWEESFGGRYVLYVGELEVLLRDRRYEHHAVNPCDPHDSASIEFPMPPHDAYFLVTQIDNGVESSYGRDSFGRERPASEPCP